MANTENDPLEPTDQPDNNGGGLSPEAEKPATDPPDNNGGGATAQ